MTRYFEVLFENCWKIGLWGGFGMKLYHFLDLQKLKVNESVVLVLEP